MHCFVVGMSHIRIVLGELHKNIWEKLGRMCQLFRFTWLSISKTFIFLGASFTRDLRAYGTASFSRFLAGSIHHHHQDRRADTISLLNAGVENVVSLSRHYLPSRKDSASLSSPAISLGRNKRQAPARG